ncbi:DeoR/GlpR family transcriptional regulator [Litoribrevibacter albus]|uniref:DeoR/GlpR family transcriptional regulator n=1 Tax=Litoribrevibacter albus TaxID=1473156 RepID=A0AA37W7L3_9GAMM|nr:DeoR/GlpR family transcriptional regulator [Litoribrevibacter albus]GLQ32667.1 DeoR/GlpR family transcriptional regulator [Litoribrevibacter albus]
MAKQSRHELILKLVAEHGYISNEELASRCQVTPQTIRRDLNELADNQQLSRHHGGAGTNTSIANAAYSQRRVMQHEQKARIAQRIAQQVPNFSSLFINIGTTTEEVAKALLNHTGLQIITNNLNVANILSAKEDFDVLVAGGTVRKDGGIVGQGTEDFINQFKVDFGIVGISGIDEDGSLLDYDYREVRVSQAIIKNSRQVLLAADHTKFGRNATIRLGNITDAHQVYTDQATPTKIKALLDEHQVNLIIC